MKLIFCEYATIIKQVTVYGLLLTFLLGCGEEEASSFQVTCSCESDCGVLSLEESERIDIPVEGFQYKFDITFLYAGPTVTQYWGYSKYDRKFFVYDLERAALADTIAIALNGVHAVPEIFGFQVIAPDSILPHTNHFNQLILMNSEAEKLKTWSIKGDLPGEGRADGMYYLAAWDGINFHYDEERHKATFFVYNMGFKSGAHPVERVMYPQFADLNLSNGQYLAAYGDYPDIYKNKELTDYNYISPFTIAKGDTWSSYFSSHCIYVFRQDRNKRAYCSKSRFLPDKFELLPRGLQVSERDPKLIARGGYHDIIYDKYRDIFYRIVLHDLPEHIQPDRDWKLRKRVSWSVMFVDDAGNCLGEAPFEGGVYDFDRIFPVKDGLLVSLENPYNTRNEEEMLSFQLFDVDAIAGRE